MTGRATDIAANANYVWITGDTWKSSGYDIHQWNGAGWNKMGGTAVEITIGANTSLPWVVNSKGEIFQRNLSGWTKMPGKASDIEAGYDEVYICGLNLVGYNAYDLYQYDWNSNSWCKMTGSGMRISVDYTNNRHPVVVNGYKRIFTSYYE